MSENELHPLAVRRAQDAFLKAIEVHCPEVLKSLAGAPLDLYRERNLPDPDNMMDAGIDPGIDHRLLLALFHPGAQPVAYGASRDEAPEQARPAFESLGEWAKSFNLPVAPWIISRAGLTVQWWVHREGSGNAVEENVVGRCWFYDSAYYRIEMYPPLEVRFAPFDSARDSKADYRKWAVAEFERLLQQYLTDKPEHWRHGKQKEEHFEWLALFLVKFKTQRSLAIHLKKRRSTVSEALTSTAALLGISLPTD